MHRDHLWLLPVTLRVIWRYKCLIRGRYTESDLEHEPHTRYRQTTYESEATEHHAYVETIGRPIGPLERELESLLCTSSRNCYTSSRTPELDEIAISYSQKYDKPIWKWKPRTARTRWYAYEAMKVNSGRVGAWNVIVRAGSAWNV